MNSAYPRNRKQAALLGAVLLWPLLLLSSAVSARVDIDPVNPSSEQTWNGGDLSFSVPFCVQSTEEPNPHGTTRIPYQVTLLTNPSLSNGAEQVSAQASWQDLRINSSTNLTPGAASAEIMTGARPNCPGGNNGQLTLVFSHDSMTEVSPGVYSGTISIRVENSGGGRNSHDSDITLTIIIPDTVRISQLENMDLGIFNGNDITLNQELCVFRGSGGNYGVTISGISEAGRFLLVQGDSRIPYTVSWADGITTSIINPGTLLGNRGNSFSGNDHCNQGAANNATLGISLLANEVNQSATDSGPHQGTLTIMVELQ